MYTVMHKTFFNQHLQQIVIGIIFKLLITIKLTVLMALFVYLAEISDQII